VCVQVAIFLDLKRTKSYRTATGGPLTDAGRRPVDICCTRLTLVDWANDHVESAGAVAYLERMSEK
jgi:hypothetical protein